ncbi:MAG: YggT family protein [Brasilonema octagenarum HA4186-MV1]|jgi:YggT family protein|uniref:YggT family protein n=2 Tax=Brasilonema TaxID=383614 RepID=A0A856MHP3_9CYAN|nr:MULTISPECIES: YggT family protein [Brasilonema]MBW4624227.1 YggT family protein [Brasilonema octagenarum HA4186-MV1]NMF63199.1 YggT family protein [Brasilonema octagenarum UFV-OR1]QDL09151.1 YggT family protein [Brasilonema sennae CENA114]QDL15508.1 YggT family protein [Brasilonema octagenarum UFV-E1]
MDLLIDTLSKFIQIYSLLLIIRVLLTWFPSINWYNQPFAALSQISDPYLNLFRSIIPPLGGIDVSPILAFLLLNVLGGLLSYLSANPLVG